MGSDQKEGRGKRELKTRDILRLAATLVCSGVVSFYVYATSQAGGFSPSELGLNSFLFLGLLYALSLPIMWAVGLVAIPSRSDRKQGSMKNDSYAPKEGPAPTSKQSTRKNRDNRNVQVNGEASLSRRLAKGKITLVIKLGPEPWLVSNPASRTVKEPAPTVKSTTVVSHDNCAAYKCACGLEFSGAADFSDHDEQTGHAKNQVKRVVIEGRPIHDSAYRVLSGF
jgi:hypothetical protein